MAATTYSKISEQIRTLFYGGIPSDDANFSLRFVAELVAQDIAYQARKDAFENSNAGETTYASDLFTSTFTNVAVTYDSVLKQFYSILPATPPALPNDQEITSVTPNGIQYRRRQVIPMKNKDKFMQDLLEPIRGTVLCYIENGKLYYDNVLEFMFPSVNITMVGAVSTTGDLLTGVLNVSKNVESDIIDRTVQRLRQLSNVPADVLNDARDKTMV